MQTVREIYQKNILILSEKERLKMIELIVRDIARETKGSEDGTGKAYGMWEGKQITEDEYRKLDHNDRIDFDLAKSYADTHEDDD